MKSALSLAAATLALGFFAMPAQAGAMGAWPQMTTDGSAQALPGLVQRVDDDDDNRRDRRKRRWRDDDDDDNRGRRWRRGDDDDDWRRRRNWRW